MGTPKDKEQAQDVVGTEGGEAIPDIKVDDPDVDRHDSVKGGGQRVRGTVKWVDETTQLPQQ